MSTSVYCSCTQLHQISAHQIDDVFYTVRNTACMVVGETTKRTQLLASLKSRLLMRLKTVFISRDKDYTYLSIRYLLP